ESLRAQGLRVIRELQKLYPIKRALMILQLIIPEENLCSLMEKLNAWNAKVVSIVESGNQPSLVIGPVPLNGGALNDHWDVIEPGHHPPVPLTTPELDEIKLSEVLRKQSISTGNRADKKQSISQEMMELTRQNGELQNESQLSRQFRDIAAIIMQKTVNPETKRPYTLSMTEKLMHGIHFSVDPHNRSNSKKQAMGVIRELQRCYPIKRAPMRLRLTIPEENACSLMKKLNAWNAEIVSKVESKNQLSLICEMEPILLRDYDAFVRSLHGRLEILAVSVHFEKDTNVEHYDDHWDVIEPSHHPLVPLSTAELDEIKLRNGADMKQSISTRNDGADKRSAGLEVVEVKQRKCSTCNAFVGDAKQYREHVKSSWHTHNLRRKTRELPRSHPMNAWKRWPWLM
ncbi:hypothetical protein MKW98_027397, partial [Papaver atlanticum]